MAKTEFTKETAIKSMLSDLKKDIGKKDTLRRIATNCKKDRATLYRWYSEAEKKFQPFLKKIKEVEDKVIEQVVTERVISEIMTLERRKQRLSEIAEQNATFTKEVVSMGSVVQLIQYPTFADVKSCIDLLNKMDGVYVDEDEDSFDQDLNITIEEI